MTHRVEDLSYTGSQHAIWSCTIFSWAWGQQRPKSDRYWTNMGKHFWTQQPPSITVKLSEFWLFPAMNTLWVCLSCLWSRVTFPEFREPAFRAIKRKIGMNIWKNAVSLLAGPPSNNVFVEKAQKQNVGRLHGSATSYLWFHHPYFLIPWSFEDWFGPQRSLGRTWFQQSDFLTDNKHKLHRTW